MGEILIRAYAGFFWSGLAAELGPQKALMLLAVATFMDEDGICQDSCRTKELKLCFSDRRS